MATTQWEPMAALVTARQGHACCAVRDTLVVLAEEREYLESGDGGRLWISRHCHEAGYTVPPRSRWMRATAPPDKFSYSEGNITYMYHCRRWTLWIWPPVRVRDSLTSSARALIMPRLGCRMGVSSAREVSMNRRRRCGARRVRGG